MRAESISRYAEPPLFAARPKRGTCGTCIKCLGHDDFDTAYEALRYLSAEDIRRMESRYGWCSDLDAVVSKDTIPCGGDGYEA